MVTDIMGHSVHVNMQNFFYKIKFGVKNHPGTNH